MNHYEYLQNQFETIFSIYVIVLNLESEQTEVHKYSYFHIICIIPVPGIIPWNRFLQFDTYVSDAFLIL